MKLTAWAKRSAGTFAQFSMPLAIGVVLFCLYLSALPARYTTANQSGDAGDLITATLTGGVPHPTGYPTYLLAATLFQQLPIGTSFYRAALLSAVFAALAAALVALHIADSTEKDSLPATKKTGQGPFHSPISVWFGAAAALALGTSPLYWSQAVIVEVYALQAFFSVCFVLWLKQLTRQKAKPDRKLAFLSIILGLGLGNHITLLLFFPAVFFANRRANLHRSLKSLALVALSAIAIYAILPLRAAAFPPINWGNPQNFNGLVWLVSGQLYHGLAFGLPLAQVPARSAYWAGWWFTQFGAPGVLLGIAGMVKAVEDRQWDGLWIFGISSLFSIGYLTNDSVVYLLPAALIFALWIGSGFRLAWNLPGRMTLAGRLVVMLFCVLLVLRLPDTYRSVDPRGDDNASRFAESCLAGLPPAALVITQADSDTFPLWYAHFGLRQRLDVAVIVRGMAGFSWYRETLEHTYPGLALPANDDPDWESHLAALNPGRAACRCEVGSTEAKVICSTGTALFGLPGMTSNAWRGLTARN
jgi:hypothetical protein